MSLRRHGPCWAVELYDDESHHDTFADAELTARDLATDGSPYARPKREAEYCWTVECVCGDPLDDDDDYGPGTHYPLDWARQVERDCARDHGGLCMSCGNARALGSVSSMVGRRIVPASDTVPSEAPHRVADGQLTLGDEPVPGCEYELNEEPWETS